MYPLTQCYNTHNTGLTGGLEDFPLCAAELQANMMAVLSTPECYRRATVITNLGAAQCDPLGDQNVWSTLFELDSSKGIIMIATKVIASVMREAIERWRGEGGRE